MLQSPEEREVFIRQLRLNNFGPRSEKRSSLRPPRGPPGPPGPPDAGPGPGPSGGPRIVASTSHAKKRN